MCLEGEIVIRHLPSGPWPKKFETNVAMMEKTLEDRYKIGIQFETVKSSIYRLGHSS